MVFIYLIKNVCECPFRLFKSVEISHQDSTNEEIDILYLYDWLI